MGHQVAYHPELIDAGVRGMSEHRVQGDEIPMHIGEDRCSHKGDPKPGAFDVRCQNAHRIAVSFAG